MSTPQVWFITGASSGLGRAVTEAVLKHGHIAAATLRTPSAIADIAATYAADKLLVIKCDVSKPGDIAAAFAQTLETFGHCDVVLNNAGYGVLGEFEGTSDGIGRGLFDVNFWGAVDVTREALRVFRESNPSGAGGRLLNMSSMVGIRPLAGLAMYSASKFALEGFTGAVAQELDPAWNIKVTIVEPGVFRTRGATDMVNVPTHPAYTNPALATHLTRGLLAKEEEMAGDPHRLAVRILEFAALLAPPLRWTVGNDAIGLVRQQLQGIAADVDAYEHLSEGLTFEE